MAREAERLAPVIAVDATETSEGRATFTLAALHHCRTWLDRVRLKLIDLTDENVALACDVLRWEDGIEVSRHPPQESGDALASADLYVAVAFRTCQHLRLADAAALGIPILLAVQFPAQEWRTPSVVLRERAAFDPRELAQTLHQVVSPWL